MQTGDLQKRIFSHRKKSICGPVGFLLTKPTGYDSILAASLFLCGLQLYEFHKIFITECSYILNIMHMMVYDVGISFLS